MFLHVSISGSNRYVKLICLFLKVYRPLLKLFVYFPASGMRRLLSGRATTEASPSRGRIPSDRIVVQFTDIFDEVSIARIHHTATCGWCRRLWSTLQFRHPYADGQVWAGMIAEFLKLLGTTGVQSESLLLII